MVYRDGDSLLNDKRLSPAQSKLMRKFSEEKTASGGISYHTTTGYLYALRELAVFTRKPFEKVTKDDMIKFLNYKAWHSASPKVYLKAFFKWLYPSPRKYPQHYTEDKPFPDIVAWIKVNNSNKRELPTGILTKAEVKKMIDCAGGELESVSIFVLYESAARAGEFLGIRIKDVEFDEYGARVFLDGKTGGRRIRLIDSAVAVRNWLNNHPDKRNPDALLFPLGSNMTLGRVLKVAISNAGIKKDVFPHLMRHSRLTEMAKTLKEPSLRVFAGWSPTSKMPAIYVHLSGADIDKQMLEDRGVLKHGERMSSERDNKLFESRKCLKCGRDNPFSHEFCSCGAPLTVEAMMHQDKQDEEVKEIGNELLFERIKKLEAALESRIGKNID